MTPQRWQLIDRIFKSAIERTPAERAAFIIEACDDDELRAEVESLISAHEQTGEFLDAPAYEVADLELADHPAMLAVGQTINHYQVLGTLGIGGMGEVYLAYDTRLGRRIALKLLPHHFTADQDRLRRFEQEARAASVLNHPNVCVIYEVGETVDDRHFIAMEYVEGVTLRQRMAETRLKMSEVLDIAVQVASALTVAHAAGIVHRDIKPENIVVRSDGYIKVLDFGLAKLMEPQATDLVAAPGAKVTTDTGTMMGTSRYMSPEQVRGLAVDARTDIWSLGVMIYEMVTGEAPFNGETTSDVIVSILDREPQPLEHCGPSVPAELQEIVSKMLSKSREERYQTIEELAGKLKSLKQELEYAARNETAGELATRTGKQVKRLTSSAKYLIGGIKGHQKAVALTAAVLITTLAASAYFHFARSPTTIDSLAALPFVNVGADPNTEYLSDGITESLINSLSQLPNLKVISFSSVSRYRGQQIDPQAVARDLGVRALLVGKVIQRGDDLLVSAELVDARDNSHIWGEQYNRKLSGLLALQQEISREISGKLRQELSGEQKEQLTKRFTESPEAYQLYLKGRYHALRLTRAETDKGIAYFQQAIESDPNYARAYIGLAGAYTAMALTSDVPSWEVMPKAKAAALQAVKIDPSIAEAHANLGYVNFWYDWDWQAAEKEYRRALELNPNSADTHQAYAHLLSNIGRHAQALDEIKLARELDPLSLATNAIEGQILFFAGNYDAALDRLKKTIDLEPNFWLSHLFISRVFSAKGMHAEAIAAATKAKELSGATEAIALTGYGFAKSGETIKARTVLQELSTIATTRYVPSYNIAIVYNGLGEREKALDYLERGYEEKDLRMVFLKVDPKWNEFRSNARFISLLKRMRLE
jgi:serine/threonine-protein kinase